MKKWRWLFVIGLGGLILWWKRHDLVPTPPVDQGPPPRFRTGQPDRTTGNGSTLQPPPQATSGPASEAAPPDTASAGTTSAGAEPDDLQRVKGIGPVYAGRLAERGITGFAQLIAADSSAIAEALDVAVEAVDDWKRQAAEFG